MRIDFTSSGIGPLENTESNKTGRAGTGAPTTGASGNSGRTPGGSSSATVEGTLDGTLNGTLHGTSGVDRASFSFDQTRVQSLAAQVLAQAEIREAKVQSLQQAISDGEYSVPPAHVASALVAELSTGTNG